MSAAAADAGSLVGQTIGGKFAVEAHIGSGAMGDVYRATHVGLGRPVALKVMRTDLSDDTFVARFQREARAASALDHPNTVRVLDFGTESSGLAYIAMELLGGRDLYEVIKRDHPLAPDRIVDLLGQALSAMKAAHRVGIVHRDIKPENIMVTVVPDEDGEPREVVKVCDFGIAKVIDSRALQTEPGRALTGTGTLVGTPEYMSPEQARGEPLDARSDLYSMGVVLFQMLTARVPFSSETPIGVVVKQVTDTPPRPSSWVPGIDPRLEEVCLRALEKRPEDRYQTAHEMRSALRGAEGGSAPFGRLGSQVSFPSLEARLASSDGRLPAARESDFGSRPTLLQNEPELAERAATPTPSPNDVAPNRPQKKRRQLFVPFLALVLFLGGVVGVVAVIAKRQVVAATNPSASGAATTDPPASATDPHPTATHTAHDPTAPKHTTLPVHAPSASGKKPPPLPSASASNKPAPVASTSAAPSAAPTPSAPPEPPAPTINTDGAFVRVGHVQTSTGAVASVTAFMNKATPTLSSCYRAALKGSGTAKTGTMSLSLSLDDHGKILSAVVVPGPVTSALPDLPRCFQGALGNQTVGPIDATTTADIQLALVVPH